MTAHSRFYTRAELTALDSYAKGVKVLTFSTASGIMDYSEAPNDRHRSILYFRELPADPPIGASHTSIFGSAGFRYVGVKYGKC